MPVGVKKRVKAKNWSGNSGSVRTEITLLARANHRRAKRLLHKNDRQFVDNIGGGGRPENGEMRANRQTIPVILAIMPVIPALHARAAIPARSSVSASGCQSMETKPGTCSTRLNQARIAGKVERSKSHWSATWV